ncbi:MAG: cyclic nucleotide-binding domain-containing protein, partial [Clostridia bacterium]
LALGQARYALRYWLLDPRHDDGTDSAVRMHLLAALERKGISPSLPKQMTHEFKETEERDAARREREADQRAATLRGVELFSMLTEAERHELAAHLVPAPFAAGDVVTRQGMVAHWLYILAEGEVDIWLEAEGGRKRVATLEPGSVFGEMGMMTGEPRRATVTARNDVQCYRLDKEAFAGVLQARPEIADGLARVLAKRGAELAQAAEQPGAPAAQARHEGLVARIRAFFGLEEMLT